MGLCAGFRNMERVKMRTKIMSISALRRQTNAVIRSIQEGQAVVYITQYGRPAAVMPDYEQYEALLAQTRRQAQWSPDYIAQTYGALADDPLVRADQGEYEAREPV